MRGRVSVFVIACVPPTRVSWMQRVWWRRRAAFTAPRSSCSGASLAETSISRAGTGCRQLPAARWQQTPAPSATRRRLPVVGHSEAGGRKTVARGRVPLAGNRVPNGADLPAMPTRFAGRCACRVTPRVRAGSAVHAIRSQTDRQLLDLRGQIPRRSLGTA